MKYEVFAKGSQIIEADSADEARKIYAELVSSEPTADFIYAEEIEDEE